MISVHHPRRLLLALLASVGAAVAVQAAPAAAASGYVPGEIVIGYAPGPAATLAADVVQRMGIRRTAAPSPEPSIRIMRLPTGETVAQAIARLRNQPGIAYAVPNFIAHEAGEFIPNDQGRSHRRAGWELMQWNFLPRAGVDAPEAWANLIADKHPGGRGTVVAILDSGVAYRNWRQFRKSPDFGGTKFVDPYDFVVGNRFPLDRNGHGTFVAGLVAEATNNKIGLTGLAYGAAIMPVRVLDAEGNGNAAAIARGIRYAANHHAQVINLSLEFPPDTTANDIPDVISAIRYAHKHGVVVVASAGNEGVNKPDYPAADPFTISVGATTSDRCLADYSNFGKSLDLVAPGGGDDSTLNDPSCAPAKNLPPVFQLTLSQPGTWSKFGYPNYYIGTSMSAPHVAAAAALVIASGILGHHPSPAQVLTRLEQTATPLGVPSPNENYGYGLLNAGAATTPVTATLGHGK
jgi:serine protease